MHVLTTVTNPFLLLLHSQLCGNCRLILEDPNTAGMFVVPIQGTSVDAWSSSVCAEMKGAESTYVCPREPLGLPHLCGDCSQYSCAPLVHREPGGKT